jgi:hypothetical protein
METTVRRKPPVYAYSPDAVPEAPTGADEPPKSQYTRQSSWPAYQNLQFGAATAAEAGSAIETNPVAAKATATQIATMRAPSCPAVARPITLLGNPTRNGLRREPLSSIFPPADSNPKQGTEKMV